MPASEALRITSSSARECSVNPPTHIDNAEVYVGTLPIDRVVDSLAGAEDSTEATSVENLQGHNLDFPVDAANTQLVSTLGADDPGAVCSMPILVCRLAVVFHKVNTVDIINRAEVSILIGFNVSRPRPNIVDEVGVSVFDAAIKQGDYNVIAAAGCGPRAHGADVSASFAVITTIVRNADAKLYQNFRALRGRGGVLIEFVLISVSARLRFNRNDPS